MIVEIESRVLQTCTDCAGSVLNWIKLPTLLDPTVTHRCACMTPVVIERDAVFARFTGTFQQPTVVL